jgi:hypothetical protein
MFLALACTAAAVAVVVPAHAAPATTLGDGFTVQAGSRLVGARTFPVVDQREHLTGWTALLEVTGPATTVYNAYAAQARSLGFDAGWSAPACEGGLTDVRCYGGSSGTGTSVFFDLRVCTSCEVPVSAMTITFVDSTAKKRRSPIPGTAPTPNLPLTIRLDAAQQAAARAALPRPGEQLGWSSIVLGAHDRALARSDLGGCARGNIVTVVSAKGDAAKIFERYVRVMPYEVPIKKSVVRFHGHPARVAHSDFGTLQVVEVSPGRSQLMVSDCDD